ncbi:MAG TPA: UrcA family protein [Steroidobacteraceae bacterium]|nr:UrcA family protein [Steroidobacteraceae bacterium]
MTSLIRSTLLGVSLTALSALGTVNAASDQPPARVVRYGDLDLTRMEGVITLYRRIRGAARDVCSPLPASDLSAETFARNCEERAVAGAVADVNAPLLTSYYMGRTRALAPALARR